MNAKVGPRQTDGQRASTTAAATRVARRDREAISRRARKCTADEDAHRSHRVTAGKTRLVGSFDGEPDNVGARPLDVLFDGDMHAAGGECNG